MQASRPVLGARRRQPPALITVRSRPRRSTVAQAGQKRDADPKTTGNLAMSAKDQVG